MVGLLLDEEIWKDIEENICDLTQYLTNSITHLFTHSFTPRPTNPLTH